jgi:hypothetical protein
VHRVTRQNLRRRSAFQKRKANRAGSGRRRSMSFSAENAHLGPPQELKSAVGRKELQARLAEYPAAAWGLALDERGTCGSWRQTADVIEVGPAVRDVVPAAWDLTAWRP